MTNIHLKKKWVKKNPTLAVIKEIKIKACVRSLGIMPTEPNEELGSE